MVQVRSAGEGWYDASSPVSSVYGLRFNPLQATFQSSLSHFITFHHILVSSAQTKRGQPRLNLQHCTSGGTAPSCTPGWSLSRM